MKVHQLEMTGFKKHIEPFLMIFTDQTNLSGKNGSGKSTTAEAITFVLFGTDVNGGKFDPSHLQTGDDVKVTMDVEVEGQKKRLERRIEKGKIKTFIEETPVTATEFKDFTEEHFTKDVFLTMFNPSYFPNLHWKEQRELMMKFIDTPLNADVLQAMPKVFAESLEPELKKQELDKLEAKHKLKAKESEERLIQLRAAIETYQKAGNAEAFDVEAAKTRLEELSLQLKVQHEQQEAHRKAIEEKNRSVRDLENVKRRINEQKELVNTLKQIEEFIICQSCGQDLPEDKAKEAEQHRQQELEEAKQKGKQLVAERNDIQAKIESLEIPEKPEEAFKLQEESLDLQDRLSSYKSRDFTKEVEEAKAEQKEVIQDKKNSVAILDAIKEFRIRRTEITVKSVNDLFTHLSVNLFDELKNGELKPTFEIEFDGKPYRLLSTAERILAGLEVRNAFITLTADKGITVPPVFVDNIESVSQDVSRLVHGQLITARVTDEGFTVKHGKEDDE